MGFIKEYWIRRAVGTLEFVRKRENFNVDVCDLFNEECDTEEFKIKRKDICDVFLGLFKTE